MQKSKRVRTKRAPKRAAGRTRQKTRLVIPGGALDLENGLGHMTSPKAIAKAIKRAADAGGSGKVSPFDSAMAALAYLIHHLETQLVRLHDAQRELRGLYGQVEEDELHRRLRLISDERTTVRATRRRVRKAIDLEAAVANLFFP
jgi:hypothetical protein